MTLWIDTQALIMLAVVIGVYALARIPGVVRRRWHPLTEVEVKQLLEDYERNHGRDEQYDRARTAITAGRD